MTSPVVNPAKTHERILQAATKQFSRNGFHRTDVQVIADLADVGKGTIYRHFGNKEKLFLATAENCLEELGKFVEEKVGDPAAFAAFVEKEGVVYALKTIALCCAEYYQKHPASIEIMLQERAEFRDRVYPSHLMFRAKHRAAFSDLLNEAMIHGLLRSVDVDLANAAYSDLIWGSCINGHLEASKEGANVDLMERMSVAIELFLKGFALQ